MSWNQRSYQRSLNEALCVLQTYFRISMQPIFYLYLFFKDFLKIFLSFFLCNFSVQHYKIYKKILIFFCPQKNDKTSPKSSILMAAGSFFSSAAPTAENSPELHFRLINSIIQSSLVGSLLGTDLELDLDLKMVWVYHKVIYPKYSKH